jgi:hypothetical protein
LLDDQGAMNLIIEDQIYSAVWSKLFKRSCFENLRFPVGKHNEDMFLMPSIFLKAKHIVYCPLPLYYYFQENESLCRSKFNYNMLDMLEALSIWNECIESQFPILSKKVRSHYYNTVINFCQYLSQKNDINGIEKFYFYQKKINNDFNFIFLSNFITINNKFKLILFKTNLFRFFFRFLSTINFNKYE